ncbi:MAG TPA: response regulator [Ignavibacteriales bacterium]|nr:response regulator [Ignavibacteriales bacterium]
MEQQTDRIRILVVDDSDVIRHALKTFFEDYNLEVLTCTDGLEGLQKAAEFKPNLIFLDLMMPNFDGLKMLQVIKVLDNLRHIPIIVISANTDRRNVLAAVEAGAERVLSKPLQKEMIIKYVNEILGSETLSKSKKKKIISENEKSDIQKSLVRFFLNSFPDKKKRIEESLNAKNRDMLKMVVHEIRGNGGTIGYQSLTALSGEVEDKLAQGEFDWSFIKLKCGQIFSMVKEIENINMSQDKK